MKLGIITLEEPNIQDFAKARNSALKKSTADWIFFVDDDEVVTPELAREIKFALNSHDFDAYLIPRRDTFLGRELKHGETGNAKFIRLAKKDFGKWVRPVHEVWTGKGRVGELKNPLLHTPHQSISTFLTKIDNYSSIEAKYRYSKGKKSSLFKIFVYPLGKFKYNYFFKLGFLDGVPGLIMAIMMSFHSYLTWTKLYLLWQKR